MTRTMMLCLAAAMSSSGCARAFANFTLPKMGPRATSAPPKWCRQPPPPQPYRPIPAVVPGRVVQRDAQGQVFVGQLVNGLREGPAELYVDTGYEVGAYHAGKKVGSWDQTTEGYLLSRCEYVDDRKSGVCVSFDPCGNQTERVEYFADLPHGHQVHWHDNGVMRSDSTYVRGVLSGLHQEWHDNGVLAARGSYVAGQKDGLWEAWHNNGLHAQEATYAHQTQVALKEWFRDGSPRVSTSSAEGATSVEYWPNGSKKSERTATASTTYFATGTKDTEDLFGQNGSSRSKTAWYPNGQMMMRAQLDAQGQVSQLERWNEDGRAVTAAEWAQNEEQKKEQMRSAAKVLELPLTILFSGLK